VRSLLRAHTHTSNLSYYTHDDVTRIHCGIIFTECDIDLPADPSPLGGRRRTPSTVQHREEEKTHTHDNDDTYMNYVYYGI